MQTVYYKSFFKKMTRGQIREWIDKYRENLIGSAIFTRSNNFGAKIVAWAEGWTCPDKKGFIPSHTGSIIEKDGDIFIFDMKPRKATIQSLERYLWLTKEDFLIILRDFGLNTQMFCSNMLYHVGQPYPYMSAIWSVFSKRPTQWQCHCSEMHCRQLQLQGHLKELNPEITPDELMHAMLGGI